MAKFNILAIPLEELHLEDRKRWRYLRMEMETDFENGRWMKWDYDCVPW
jgi:hypothetical protein